MKPCPSLAWPPDPGDSAAAIFGAESYPLSANERGEPSFSAHETTAVSARGTSTSSHRRGGSSATPGMAGSKRVDESAASSHARASPAGASSSSAREASQSSSRASAQSSRRRQKVSVASLVQSRVAEGRDAELDVEMKEQTRQRLHKASHALHGLQHPAS